MVFAALDLDWFNRFGSDLPAKVPKGASWTEIDSAGSILVRYPSPETWVGRSLPERALLQTVFSSPSGIVKAPGNDGVGFDPAGLRANAMRGVRLGLLSMEERAVLAGGGLEFVSAPGQGTEVHAWFPLKWQATAVETSLYE